VVKAEQASNSAVVLVSMLINNSFCRIEEFLISVIVLP
jgi:hypothetical protein